MYNPALQFSSKVLKMPSSKRPVRKSSSAPKARPAASAKGRAGRSGVRKASSKPAPAKRVPASKVPARTKPATKAAASKTAPSRKPETKVATKATSKATAKATARVTANVTGKPTGKPAARLQAPAAREMVVRTAPGMVKTSGRKPATHTQKATRRAAKPYDPNALIHGIRPYLAQSGDPYMGPQQLDHFRKILRAWKRELMEEVDRTVHHMQDEASNFPDPNDRATQESEFGLELRTRDRERKLLKKIDAALERIEDRSYGYCEETGEEIGLKRLEARPVATLSLEAQERREMSEKQYGERDDRYA